MGAAITSITGLQNLTNLRDFRADWNSLTSIDFSGLTNLTYVDISDCEVPGTSDHSLTSVNLTGCTALEQLRMDDSNFSAGIPNLAGLNNLYHLDIDGCGITGHLDLSQLTSLTYLDLNDNTDLTSVNLSGLTNLNFFDADQCNISGSIDLSSCNSLTGLDLSDNPNLTSVILPEANLNNVDIARCALTSGSINYVLNWLDGSGVTGGWVYLDGETNSYPTGDGITAKNNLINKGWDVQTNIAPPGRVGIAASTDFDIVGNFTIEMFVNMNNSDGFPRPYSFGAYPAPNAISIEGGQLYFWANGTAALNGPFTPTLGQWYHICVQRSGNTLQMYVDGTSIASTTYANNIPSQGLPLTIGYGNEDNSGFNGLMSNFRWTSTVNYNVNGFPVPTSPLGIIGDATKLLIFQGDSLNAQLLDNSGRGNNASNTGATFSTNDPFDSAAGSLQMGNA